MSDMSDLSPEELQQLISLGSVPGKQDLLKQQMQYANQLRSTPLGQGRDSGRVYTAPSILETLGNVAQKYQGGEMAKGLMDKQGALLDQQTAGRKQYLQMLLQQLRNGGGGAQAPQAGSMQGGGGGTTTYFGGPQQ